MSGLLERTRDHFFMPLVEAARLAGLSPHREDIQLCLIQGPPELLRILLQAGTQLPAGSQSLDAEKQAIICQNLAVRASKKTGDTPLHVALKSKDVTAVKGCFAQFLSPFVANYHGQIPLDVAPTPELRSEVKGVYGEQFKEGQSDALVWPTFPRGCHCIFYHSQESACVATFS